MSQTNIRWGNYGVRKNQGLLIRLHVPSMTIGKLFGFPHAKQKYNTIRPQFATVENTQLFLSNDLTNGQGRNCPPLRKIKALPSRKLLALTLAFLRGLRVQSLN